MIHFISLLLTAITVALLMTPAAYHRLCEPDGVSEYSVRLSSRLIAAAMIALAIALSLDIYVVAEMIFTTAHPTLSGVTAALVLLILGALWVGFPLWRTTGGGLRVRFAQRHTGEYRHRASSN